VNMSRLSNKVAIVTGASKGIGGGIATALGTAGARVAVNYSSDRKGAERIAQEITDNGGQAIAVGADVSKAAEVARLFKEVDSAFGRLDVLVNKAGVFRFGALAEITEESFHLHYDINVLGTILTVQEATKRFGLDGGSIINLSSIVGSHPVAGALLYASTKGAIETLTKGLALELAPRKIRVNAIAFGVGAGEILAAVQIAMIARLPYTGLRDAVLTHPTLVEGLIPLFSSAASTHNVAEKRRAQTSSI
jgi:3-oxoacyl-[acyl-carrier protein] reductase